MWWSRSLATFVGRPGTFSSSSRLAAITASGEPNCLISAFFRFGPTPGTLSSADAVIAHVGTTVGGSIGVTQAVVSWDHTVKVTQDIIDAARSVRKDVFTLTHGGPINSPKDVEFILSKTSADGFVGASSLERMGVEDSLTALTREFKRVPVKRS